MSNYEFLHILEKCAIIICCMRFLSYRKLRNLYDKFNSNLVEMKLMLKHSAWTQEIASNSLNEDFILYNYRKSRSK